MESDDNGEGISFLHSPKQWMNVDECALFFATTRQAIAKWRDHKNSNFPKARTLGAKKNFYNRDELLAWFEDGGVAGFEKPNKKRAKKS